MNKLNEISNKKEVIDAILQSLRDGATITAACETAKIGRVTLYYWRQDDPILDAAVEDAKKSRPQMVEDSLYKAAIDGNTTAQIFYLKNKGGWKDSPAIEVNTYTQVWNHAIDKAKAIDERGRVTRSTQ